MAKHANSIQDIIKFALEGASSSELKGVSISEVETIANDIADCVQLGLDISSKAPLNPEIKIIATKPTMVSEGKDGKGLLYEFKIQAEGELSRPSLSDKNQFMNDFGEGGIITLLNDGYVVNDTKSAYKLEGTWNGIEFGPNAYHPLLVRPGAQFLQNAMSAYKNYIVDYNIDIN